jgi:hypothetical protein
MRQCEPASLNDEKGLKRHKETGCHAHSDAAGVHMFTRFDNIVFAPIFGFRNALCLSLLRISVREELEKEEVSWQVNQQRKT